MRRKRVLLTNFNILNYSGSEIDTVSIANYFNKNNYDVTIFTLEYDNPLKEIVDSNIKVIVPNDISKLDKKYDLIWAHHYPLLDYLIFALKIKANHIVYVSLSYFEPLEMLPDYYTDLSIIATITEEIKKKLNRQMLIKKPIVFFPNYAPSDYFKYPIKSVTSLIKICIVSNHVPNELLEFKEIALKNKIIVDIYGLGNIVKYVDSEVINKYDVVISIGKTIYYTLALGKISYCYDRFGGYGFLTSKNVDKYYQKNFSGRGGVILTAQEIYQDIINNYQNINKELELLRKYAYQNFHFETNISKILKLLDNTNIVDCNKIVKKYPFLQQKSHLYVENINVKNNVIKSIQNENNYLKNLISEIYNSFSWKITYPIRFLKIKIVKLKRMIK